MTLERWLEANALFEKIIDLPVPERSAALQAGCGEDIRLRAIVVRLMRADAAADDQGFLKNSPDLSRSLLDDEGRDSADGLVQETNDQESPAIPVPERLGQYRILGEIGRGGMGTIYAAARDDDTMDQQVAIKVIRAGAENEDIVRRMRLERQILARLQHPNIAQIYDAGSTGSGLPYFVMELVDGMPIDQFCTRHELSLHDRLRLIRKVCAAVQYANENLIIHRDLKPSNILVTPDGEPKLLDFGIAKVLDPDPRQATDTGQTEPWKRRMTLEYASPEQLRGLLVSVSCDVYSLGVLLFLLLTGEIPRSAEGLTSWLFDRQLRSTAPPRPSQVVAEGGKGDAESKPGAVAPPMGPAMLSRKLAGDLDSIVLGALQDDPRARYNSAQELGDDLERYLEGFPVVARHGSVSYRFGKFLRRHVQAVALVVVFLGLGSALLGSVIHSGAQATRNLARLEVEHAKREQLLGAFLGIFSQAGPLVAEGVPLTLPQAVDRFMERSVGEFEDQPGVQAAIFSTLGWIYLDLGSFDKAHHYHRQALELRSNLGASRAEEVESLVGVAAALREQLQLDEARTLSNQALALVGTLEFIDPKLHLKALNHHVALLCFAKDWQTADPVSQQALLVSQSLANRGSGEVVIAASQRAQVLRWLGDLEEARELYGATLEALKRHGGPEHPLLAVLHNNVGEIAYREERFEVAIEAWTLADHQYREVYGEDYYGRVFPLSNLGKALLAGGWPTEAELALRQAIQVAGDAPALGPRHERRYFGTPAVELAELLLASDRCGEVLELLEDKVGNWKDSKLTRKAQEQVRRCGGDVAADTS